MDNQYNKFMEELSQVPPVPDKIFHKIESRIYRRNVKARLFLAVAASIVLAAGITTSYLRLNAFRQTEESAYKAEVIYELESAYNFLNANDIDEEIETYALVDPEIL